MKLQQMQAKGHRLSNEILGIETPAKAFLPSLDFELIINKQQRVIQQLQHQIKCLREYVKYCTSNKQTESESETDCSLRNDQSAQKEPTDSKPASNGVRDSGLKNLVKDIMRAIEAESIDMILSKIKLLVEKANRKTEPIFVERIKIKEVAVPVQIIKQVEKQVIVYQEKVVEVPIFREKIVEKFVERPAETGAPTCNPNKSLANTCEETESRQKEKDHQVEREQDFMKKKLNFVESPRQNQTYSIKSPRFREKEEYRNNFIKSPKYKAKDSH